MTMLGSWAVHRAVSVQITHAAVIRYNLFSSIGSEEFRRAIRGRIGVGAVIEYCGENVRLLHNRFNKRILPDHRLSGSADREEFASRLD